MVIAIVYLDTPKSCQNESVCRAVFVERLVRYYPNIVDMT
jgi:hypothetical protein